MKPTKPTSAIFLGVVSCLSSLVNANPTPTLKDAPSRTLETRDAPGASLQADYYWIRSVVAPFFHFYMQSVPSYATGHPIMGPNTSAGQFQVQDGQLVQLVDTDGTLLYMNVEQPADDTAKKLAVSFETEQNTFGTFSWSGDALWWSVPSIERPNNGAWLICEDDLLYINLGPYAWDTPAGCGDATIHYYNAAQADP
ncbi:hypothetical protein AJ80_06087 [Polytolypa hystricis UAMH7299]|uniref:Uncharacterized protein n=1 Tax=Polytolypa hystricis (strain UAMH7299) TaxID=1447883 RepID=A0A2B7XZ76_POLH7|nr:hypothetical protein AJ80_06087 [Polytolypa hystricis UAMH7299]